MVVDSGGFNGHDFDSHQWSLNKLCAGPYLRLRGPPFDMMRLLVVSRENKVHELCGS